MKNTEGAVQSKEHLHIAAHTLDNSEGILAAQNSLAISAQAGSINNSNGSILTDQDTLILQADSMMNDAGDIASNEGEIVLSLADHISNIGGSITTNNKASINTRQLNNNHGTIQSNQDLMLQAHTIHMYVTCCYS